MDLRRIEDFLGGMLQVYGPNLLRYKGVLNVAGEDRRIVFQGVHMLMGADNGPRWKAGEMRESKIVFIGRDLPRDMLVGGLDLCVAPTRAGRRRRVMRRSARSATGRQDLQAGHSPRSVSTELSTR